MIPRLFAIIRNSIAHLRADTARETEGYVTPLDVPALFRWVLGSQLADDGWTTIVPTGTSSYIGAWVRVREDDKGADLTSSSTSLTVGGKRWRRIPISTLSADQTIALSTTNAAAGDWILITREDVGAYTVALTNSGPAAGTVVTLPVSARSWALLYFDGVNWLHRASGMSL